MGLYEIQKKKKKKHTHTHTNTCGVQKIHGLALNLRPQVVLRKNFN